MYVETRLPLGLTLWQSRNDVDSTIPADGCTDLILRNDHLFVAGPSTRWIATNSDGDSGSVGLRLPPGFAGAVLGTSAVELVDRAAAIEDALPHDAAAGLRSAMLSVARSPGQVDAISAHVLDRMAPSRPRLNFIRHAAGRAASVGAVAAELGESERTLRRRMLSDFGYGYATLVRIRRAAQARQFLEQGTTSSEAAAAAGFADQAHLTREFRRLVGLTPAQFSKSSA
ncbi:AraC-like DNA-binding protein [Microbacterium sp. SORGH_AS 1204]|uniref:helix-turn-helix domain-containing protein n=1 Tax=Microbacterium sp. SORGH_AS_1204 TaxID=3041785 RepID=UPI00278FF65B|nr:helix-turn-helix domain-containing protein [Microbacterium sp. SORGH_AS_1204]MDQ1135739.1 AraC-like DNA-binding protein [Microbacterium sp. SORGH_AS_1204]